MPTSIRSTKQFGLDSKKFFFEFHTNAVKSLSVKTFKLNERNMGSKVILLRYIDFALCLYRIASIHSDNNMLRIRITELKNLMVDLLKKSAKEIPNEVERTTYLISSIDFISSNFTACNFVFQEDIMSLEKDVSVHVDKMVEIGLQEYFAHMIDFVKQYAKDENEGGGYVQDKNVNFKLIENISAEFSENWIKRVEAFKDLCYKNFNNSGAFKKIMKKFLQNLLNSYGKFNKYVKENYSGFANSIPQLHMIMKEIQNQEKKLAV